MTATELLPLSRFAREHPEPKARQWDEKWQGELYMPPMANVLHNRLRDGLLFFLQLQWAIAIRAWATGENNLVHPDDESDWTSNYRIPDVILIPEDRKHIDHGEYLCGAPLVVVEIRSLGDRSYDKLDFYVNLEVPEVWIIDRSSRHPEVFVLTNGEYVSQGFDADGWLTSPATGVQFRRTEDGKLRVRITGQDATITDIPEN